MFVLTINVSSYLSCNENCILLTIFSLTTQYYIKCKFFYQYQFYNYGYKKLSLPKMWEKNKIDT